MIGGVLLAPFIGRIFRPALDVTALYVTPILGGVFGALGFWIGAFIAGRCFAVNTFILLAVAVGISFVTINEHVNNRTVLLSTQIVCLCLLFGLAL